MMVDREYHTWQQELQYRRATMTKKNNVDVEFDSDVGYPYHLQPDIIKMALFIHNATSEQEKRLNELSLVLTSLIINFMAHVNGNVNVAMVNGNKNMDSKSLKQWQEDREEEV